MSTWQNKGDYLFVEVSEPYSLKLAISTIHEVTDHCQEENLYKVLIDMSKVEGHLSIFDRYLVGIEIVRLWGLRIKAVVLAKPSMINRVTENTAVNRGAKLHVVSDMESALQWLEVEYHDETVGV
jgi:hypothetical protein